jgi:hypothetical protein
MIEQFACVALTRPRPGAFLEAGDIGTVVDVYKHGEAYEVEFSAEDGEMVALLTLKAEDVTPVDGAEGWEYRPIANTTIPHVTLTTA